MLDVHVPVTRSGDWVTIVARQPQINLHVSAASEHLPNSHSSLGGQNKLASTMLLAGLYLEPAWLASSKEEFGLVAISGIFCGWAHVHILFVYYEARSQPLSLTSSDG